MNSNNRRNIGKISAIIILLSIVIAIVFLLFFQFIFLNRLNREHAFETGEVFTDQIGNILETNDRKQQILTETLKENYISKAKAVAYYLDNNPEAGTDISELDHIAGLMSIDEIHLFTEEGEIYFGTVPKYYGYSFDSGEQMGYFKPMLTDKTLSMCQDVTPNTAEEKSMMYAICWNSTGNRMIQIGIEPVRLLEELHANKISEVVDGLPINTGMNVIVSNLQTGEILGTTLADLTGASLPDSNIPVNMPAGDEIINYTATLNNERVYCSVSKTDKYLIFISQSVKEVNSEIPIMMLIVFLYLLLAAVTLIFIVKKLTVRILNEKRNADTDAMTGLKNRRAYESDILSLEENPETARKNLVCLMFDINELKMINDRYGHDAGDRAIKAFAEIIKKIFGSYGNIYRIGGDEFAGFLYIDYSQLGQLIEEAESELKAWSEENQINLSMSYGAVAAEEHPELTIEELLKIADESMYKSKSQFYERSGHDRRLYKKKQTDLPHLE